MSSLTKICECCGVEFSRPKNVGLKAWDKRRFCNRQCKEKHLGSWCKGLTKHEHPSLASMGEKNKAARTGKPPWNKGLTKNDHPGMRLVSESMKKIQKGREPWNKGLTKEDSPIIAQYAEKVSASQKGRPINTAQKEGLKKGRKWCLGLTKETDRRLAKRGERVGESLRGRKVPEHSKRMKSFYKKNPEKHPNAILAKKSKGHGFTYIEKLLKEYLDELGLNAVFNHRVGSKWVDFALVSDKLAIEADGEFWHSDAKKELDRDLYLQERGWGVLHLTGSVIVNEANYCKQVIQDHIGAMRS